MLKKLLYLLIITLSLGQFSVITNIVDTKIYLFDIVAIVFCCYGFYYYILHFKKFNINSYLIPLYIFSIIAVISLINQIWILTSEEILFGLFLFFRWFLYLNIANLVWNMLIFDQIELKSLIYALIYSALFVSLFGFVQLIVFPDFSALDPALGWDPHKNRLVSTFFDPNFVGGYLTLIFTLIIFSNIKKYNKQLYRFSIAVILLAIFLTYSRSSWAMVGIVIFVIGLSRSIYIIWLSLLIAFLAYFAIPRIQTRVSGITDPNDSASLRLVSWKNTLEISKDNLFLGVGFNTYKSYQLKYGFLDIDTQNVHSATGSDSSFLLILATTGILGFGIFLLSYFYPFLSGRYYLIASLSSLLLQTQFINAIFYPQIMFLWLIFIVLAKYPINKKNSIEIV